MKTKNRFIVTLMRWLWKNWVDEGWEICEVRGWRSWVERRPHGSRRTVSVAIRETWEAKREIRKRKSKSSGTKS